MNTDAPTEILAHHIRASMARRPDALEPLLEKLAADERPRLEAALSQLLASEQDGPKQLLLLDVIEKMSLTGTFDGLIEVVKLHKQSEDPRLRFLAGRASEVLLRLPLNLTQRAIANSVCQDSLLEGQRLRLQAERASAMQRPRRIEWALLAALMAMALAGIIYAFVAKG